MLDDLAIDLAVRRRAACGEGPLWDPQNGVVLWVDIIAGEILSTDYATGATTALRYPGMVGAATHRAQGGFAAAVESGFVALTAQGEVERRVDCLGEGVRMNDAKVDPRGVYWAGSCAYDFAEGRGELWRLDEDWNAERVLADLTQPNGLGWSPAGDTFYLVDTQARTLLSFPFDPGTSTLEASPTVLIGPDDFPEGIPDGLAVDEAGHLWIAMFDGGAVHEFDPAGGLVRSVGLPTRQATSCMFVGPTRDELWVTSAAVGISEQDDELAGSTFRIRGLGAVGPIVPPFAG